jgi:putative spermidine/putrescine transport system substrate-binding protein
MIRFSKTLAALLFCGAAEPQPRRRNGDLLQLPPEWADWGTQLQAIAADTGVTVPLDNKNSGQALAQLVAERAAPMADVVYYGVTFGLQAQKRRRCRQLQAQRLGRDSAGLKDPEGHWFAIHSGTLGIMVNVDALGGLPVPQSWADPAQARVQGHGRLPGPVQCLRRLRVGGGNQPRHGRRPRQLCAGHRLLQEAGG